VVKRCEKGKNKKKEQGGQPYTPGSNRSGRLCAGVGAGHIGGGYILKFFFRLGNVRKED